MSPENQFRSKLCERMIEQSRNGGVGKGNESMIEIIREEKSGDTIEKRGLPKDIKQIGKPDIGDRIYVENQVYQLLHPYNSFEEKRAYVLLGRFENYAGRQCVFVEAAIWLREIDFDGDLPLWNDQTWAYIYKQLKSEYDNMVIVGWAMDIKGQLPNMTIRLEKLHQNNFGGAHQVLYLLDSLEQEEAFYGNRSGHLHRREGFYVYYAQKSGMQMQDTVSYEMRQETAETAAEEVGLTETAGMAETAGMETVENGYGGVHDWREAAEETQNSNVDILHRGSYRRQIEMQQERRFVPSYASTLLLALVVCALGITAYFNNEKMNAMQETLAQMNQTQQTGDTAMENNTQVTETGMLMEEETNQEEAAVTEQAPAVAVENVAGNVKKQEIAVENETAQTPVAAAESASPTETKVAAENKTVQTAATEEGAEGVAEQNAAVPETEATAEEQSPAVSETTTKTESTQTMTEAQTYLNQGFYVVQKGDSLVGICKKIYQTTAMMDKLCEANGIEDENAIYAGQQLTLPN